MDKIEIGQSDAKENTSVKKWLREIQDALGREKDWREFAAMAVSIYEADKIDEVPYNVLYSNTETMSPALYNEVPRPVVRRRFKDDDPTALAASKATERALSFYLDTNELEYPPFDDLIKAAVLDSLVPGRGVTRWKYHAQIREATPDQPEAIEYETVCGEEISWDRFVHGFGKTWNKVPWIAFLHFMTKAEVKENYPEFADRIPCTHKDIPHTDDRKGKTTSEAEDKHKPALALIYEIWDKETRKVIHIADGFYEAPVKELDDPLELDGFFPICRPLMLFQKISTLVPTTLYAQYKTQAEELNLITRRIAKLIDAMRIRGFYDARVDAIEKMLAADENDLIAAEGLANVGDLRNFDSIIWIMPIDKLVGVLQQLYVQREQVKMVIYEIMGISDILRGSSKASETFGAQDLKAKWGSLRLKRMQKEVMRYCRDCLRIMGEIAMTKLQPSTLAAITGLPFVTAEQKQQAQQVMQMAQQAGQPPPPQVAEALQAPVWEEVLALLKNDLQRRYRIDVETNSTIDPEASEDQKHIAELMGALSQFLNGMAPLVVQGAMPFEAVQTMMLAVTRRFRFGDELEEQLRQMKPPQQKDDGKAKAEQARQQADMQMKQAMMQADQQMQQSKLQMEMQRMQQEQQMAMQRMQAELEIERAKLEMQMQLERDKLAQQFQIEAARMAQQKEVELYKAKISTQADERAKIKVGQMSAAASVAAANGRPTNGEAR